MTTYFTKEPLGSTSPYVLFDNAQNFDYALNDITQAIWKDRFGRNRKTYWGWEQESAAQLINQQQRFNTFIQSSGYKVIGEYTAGPLTITEYNQLIRYQGELYKLTATTPLDFTTTGNDATSWANDSAHFVSVGDAALRQELASPGGISLIAPGVMTRGADKFSIMQGRDGDYRQDTLTRGLSVEINETISGIGSIGATNTYMFNRFLIADDKVDAVNDGTSGTKVDGLIVQHDFGGAGTRGGRHAAEFMLTQKGVTESDNTDRNYVGIVGYCATATGDGGTSDANKKAAYFGGNFFTKINNAGYVTHANGCESNVLIDANSEVSYRAGYSAVSAGEKQGYRYDAAYSVGALGTSGAQWRDGLLVGVQNGRNPVSRSIIRGESASLQSIISFNGGIPANILISDTDDRFNFRVDGLKMHYNNASVSLGSKTAANTPFIAVYTDASGNRSGRIIFTGTGTVEDGGVCNLQFRQTTVRDLVPSSPSAFNCGANSLPWAGGFTQSAFTVTSDERHKGKPLMLARGNLAPNVTSDAGMMESPYADKILDAWAEVDFVQFQYLDRIEEKGEDGARWHFGVIAQRAKEAFERHGLDAYRFGFLCYDEWEDQYTKVQTNEGATVTRVVTVERPVSIVKTRTVKKPVMETRWREALVDETQEDGTKIKKVIQEEYQTPKLTTVYIYNQDGSPRIENGEHRFVYEPVLEDEEVEYTDIEMREVTEEHVEPAEPEYTDVLEVESGSRYGIRYEEALSLEAALQRRNYSRLLAKHSDLEARLEALEGSNHG
ncbi:tail fiber domain-containing protein [Leclercia adecarboxylata]